MTWLGTWENRRKITISNTNVDAVLSNFPILIKISASSGTGSTNITSIFTELVSDANRKKIAVTLSDGTTQCYVEIERWDHANSLAWLWVKVPSVASGSVTELYIYYDASKADNTTYIGDTTDAVVHNVWDVNFVGVWHMAQDPNGDGANAIKDSTSNQNDGTPGGAMTSADLVDGKIGKGIDFEGTDDYINIGDISMDFGVGGLTLEATIKASDSATDREIIFRQDDLNSHDPIVYLKLNSTGHIEFLVRGQTNPASLIDITSGGADYDDNTLRYIAGTFDDANNSGIVLINGVSDGTNSSKTTTDINFGQAKLQLGRLFQEWVPNDEGYFKDIIDEIRISDIARPSAWIKATYYSNWDGLVSYGNAETVAEITESIGMGDSVIPDHYVELLTEAAALSDTIIPDHYVEILTEVAGLDDSIFTEGIYSISLSEGVALDDSVTPDLYVETLIENAGLDDLIFTEATYPVAISESVVCDDVVTPDHYVETLTEGLAASDAYERFVEFEKSLTENVGLDDTIDVFNWTQWLVQNEYRAVKRYYLTLTGSADGKADVLLPMKSFQGRLRDGDPTYLSVVIPSVQYASQINERSNGDLVVEMAYLIDGVEQYKEQLAAVDLEIIRIDEGAKNQSITLSGHRTESFSSKNVVLDGASYYYISGGKYYYRLAKVDMYLKPGDTVEVNDDSFTVDTVSYFVSVERQQMEIAE